MSQRKCYSYKKLLLTFFCLVLYMSSHAQRGSVHWASDGSHYYVTENNEIVSYTLPTFDKKVILTSSELLPKGKGSSLDIENFTFSTSGKYLLIYTNSKKVWRQKTRGDYWIYDSQNHTLHQVGKDLPESSLMFAKISPDEQNVAYVSGHNIYVENIVTGSKKTLTTDGTSRMINGTFDWVYEEEFGCRDGFRWSPDSKHIAYWHIDARDIKNFLMMVRGFWLPLHSSPLAFLSLTPSPSLASERGESNIGRCFRQRKMGAIPRLPSFACERGGGGERKERER